MMTSTSPAGASVKDESENNIRRMDHSANTLTGHLETGQREMAP
jgi:hypothetical protein